MNFIIKRSQSLYASPRSRVLVSVVLAAVALSAIASFTGMFGDGEPTIAGRSLDHPVPFGETLLTADNARVQVLSIDPSAEPYWSDLFRARAKSPDKGKRNYSINLKITNTSNDEQLSIGRHTFKIIGDRLTTYSLDNHKCRGVPRFSAHIAYNRAMQPGTTIEGTACFEVPVAESNWVLIHQPGFHEFSRRTYMSLSNSVLLPGTPVPRTGLRLFEPGTRLSNPVLGEVLIGADGSEITLLSTDLGPADSLLSRDDSLGCAAAGTRYVVLRLRVINKYSSVPISIAPGRFLLDVGENGRYGWFDDRCSLRIRLLLPDALDAAELYTGGCVDGTIGFQIPEDSWVLTLVYREGTDYARPSVFGSRDERYLSVKR